MLYWDEVYVEIYQCDCLSWFMDMSTLVGIVSGYARHEIVQK